MKVITTLVILTMTIQCMSQRMLTGTVINQSTNEYIEFVNIGIINTTVGTCSFEDGTFKLSIPDDKLTESITFSAIGYKVRQLNIDTLNMLDIKIALEENTQVLDEIKITASREPQQGMLGLKSYGFPFASKWGMTLSSSEGGCALASRMSISERAIELKKVNFYISNSTLDNFKIRCRIQAVDQNNQPGEDLLAQNIIVSSSIKKGWISIDFTPYSLVVSEDFYLVIEWIMDKNSAKKAAEHEANPLSWKIPNSEIWNSKIMVYTNDEGEVIKQDLTKEQTKEWQARRYPKTWLGVKKVKTEDSNNFYRKEGSMASWLHDPSFMLMANVEYEW